MGKGRGQGGCELLAEVENGRPGKKTVRMQFKGAGVWPLKRGKRKQYQLFRGGVHYPRRMRAAMTLEQLHRMPLPLHVGSRPGLASQYRQTLPANRAAQVACPLTQR